LLLQRLEMLLLLQLLDPRLQLAILPFELMDQILHSFADVRAE